MNTDDEQTFARHVRQHLDQHADDVDDLTAARLRAIREQALDRQPRRGMSWLPATGLAMAVAVVLAVVIWQPGGTGLPLSEQDWDLLAAGEEMELIEEWEFYVWLEELQTNG